MALLLERFRQLSVVDFEFIPQTDGTVKVICCVWLDLRTNRLLRLWYTEFGKTPPYGTGPDCLFIAYQASAEASCHLALGWARPEFILDLYNEHRWLINGETAKPTGTSLLRAASDLGIPCITKEEKKTMRNLVLRRRSLESGRTRENSHLLRRRCGCDRSGVFKMEGKDRPAKSHLARTIFLRSRSG